MPNKLNELTAIASFNQPARIGGYEVSVQTARVILGFYNRLPHGLRRNFLSLPIDRMTQIAYNGDNPGFSFGMQAFPLSPSPNELLPFAREAYRAEEVARKKYIVPFLQKNEKGIKKVLKNAQRGLLNDQRRFLR